MKKSTFKQIFWAGTVLGIIGFVDFSTRGFVTPVFNDAFNTNLEQVGLIGSLLFDFAKAFPGLAAKVLTATIILSDVWIILFMVSYFLHKRIKMFGIESSVNKKTIL